MRREIDSPYAWCRLALAVLLSAIGGVGMWSVVVALPAVQAEFHAERGAASMPFTLTMIGFGIGGVILGRLADRKGIVLTSMIGAAALGAGFILAAFATGLPSFAAAYVLIGTFGSAATFAPLVADISFWFEKRRGIAVAICACGNYVSGAFWPTVVEAGIRSHGWRTTHAAIGIACLVAMPPLALGMMQRPGGVTRQRLDLGRRRSDLELGANQRAHLQRESEFPLLETVLEPHGQIDHR